MNEQQLQQWLTTYIGQLSPPEQDQVTAAWAKLTQAQKNQVATNAQGGPAEYAQQALTVIQQAQGGPATAPPQPMKSATQPFNAPSTSATGATPGSTSSRYAQTELLGPSGAVSSTSVGTGTTPVAGTTQAAALINQYMSTPLWQGDQNDPTSAAEGLGIDFNTADAQYQQYKNSFASAQRRTGVYNSNAAPMSETEFIQGLAMSAYGQWGPIIGMLAYEWQEQNGTALPPALAQQIIAGLKNIPANDAAQLQTQMLNSMEQISSAAKNATAAGGQATQLNLNIEISSFLTQLGTYAPSVFGGGSASGGGSSLADASPNSIIGQYITANPSATGVAAQEAGSEKTQAIQFLSNHNMALTPSNIGLLANSQTYTNMGAYVSWMQSVGMPITPDVLQQLLTMPFGNPNSSQVTAGSGGAFLLDQMVPGTHMTYGAYQQVSQSITPQWEQYFNAAPTKAQLAYFVGKSSTDINDYFSNSMSSIPGITIGQKNDYENFINSLDQQSPTVNGISHTFSSQVDDSMMNQLHQAVTAQSTGTPTPGPMK